MLKMYQEFGITYFYFTPQKSYNVGYCCTGILGELHNITQTLDAHLHKH